ncbi:DNA repair and recombination protein RAD26 [Cytospora mali]|uniref:DNA repair and recombination protein RAD26 n=1 Tax=Cytospora mali TaxID=578113 RepID=A0A194VN08_CYTMA|nr:DNA repair and recombination protein RAD26 [Valsa mali]
MGPQDGDQVADVNDDTKSVTFVNNARAASSPGLDRDGTPDDIPEDLDEESALKSLTTNVRDQEDLERDITHQASLALAEAEDSKDKNRIARAEATKLKFINRKKEQEQKLRRAWGNTPLKDKIQQEIARIDAEVELVDQDIADFNARIEERRQAGTEEDVTATSSTGKLPGETQREYLIRTGKITPFAKIGGPRPDGVEGELANAIIEAEDEAVAEELELEQNTDQPRSHRNLRLPGFAEDQEEVAALHVGNEFSLRPRKKRKVKQDADSSDEFDPSAADATSPGSASAFGSEDYDMTDLTRTTPRKTPKATRKETHKVDFSKIDDGDEFAYQRRLSDWVERRSRARRHKQERDGQPADASEDAGEEEWFKPSPDQPDHHFENGMKLPGDIYPSLFDYQKTGVQWLAELYCQGVGGIVGDEMGLGKTIQLISFIAALHYSRKLTKPVLVVAPATVLQQWVSEFHRWWPPLRVSILHSSGSGMVDVGKEERIEDEELWEEHHQPKRSNQSVKKIVDRVVKDGHVLVTTYAGLQTYGDVLIPVNWDYAVLDEGHKIRNPNTYITVCAKELRTPNRIILSGTPMQNSLIELWSLFDFIIPMHLGSLVAFRTQFEVPIKLGGYANATNLQVMTAQKCAETLKDTISPYLLQRTKKDVAADLPKKQEQVLFCKLTSVQRDVYELFLKSSDMNAILNKGRSSLYGIDHLRKICNHPDLAFPQRKNRPNYQWGAARQSGKMQVVKRLVHLWKRFGHKILLFSQGVLMLDILEAFFKRQGEVNYLRMDGKTPVKERQKLVDRFNNDPELNLFLLTTKVGGLGVNLTGASRVIIYDPDWNPSTDVQARERAWRLGQKKEVIIFRLMTAGTIEEKIYHRQIYKQFLSNKVLKDPKQRTTLNLHDMHDLFTLDVDHDGATETSRLFASGEVTTDVTPKIAPGNTNYDLEDQHARMLGDMAHQVDEDEDDKVREIDGVAGLEEFKQEDDGPAGEEDRIMAGIFARDVHETLEHDEIINGKKAVKADRTILEREANRVAAEAAEHLRRSREQARHVPIGTVTWTGEHGQTGAPRLSNNSRGRAGPGSASVLAGIRGRQGLDTGGGGGGASSSRSGTATPPNGRYGVKEFKEMIPPFIRRHGGKCPSKVLVDHFNPYCHTKKATDAFKAALNTVARMEQTGSTMRGIWSLRTAYK